jgi:hypothetical protein
MDINKGSTVKITSTRSYLLSPLPLPEIRNKIEAGQAEQADQAEQAGTLNRINRCSFTETQELLSPSPLFHRHRCHPRHRRRQTK